jgi:hypothetical protein
MWPESETSVLCETGFQRRGRDTLTLEGGKRLMAEGFLRVVHFSLNGRYSL